MDGNKTNNDEYTAKEQKDSFFSSKERKNVIQISNDIYNGLSTMSENQMISAFKSLGNALKDYLDMKEKELAGIKKNDADANRKFLAWRKKHENDQKGWGALIKNGVDILSDSKFFKTNNNLFNYASWICILCLLDSKILSISFPKSNLLKAASTGMTWMIFDNLKLENIDKSYVGYNTEIKDILDAEISNKEYKTYLKGNFKKVQNDLLSKLKKSKSSNEIDHAYNTILLRGFKDSAKYIKDKFNLEINFCKDTVKKLNSSPS